MKYCISFAILCLLFSPLSAQNNKVDPMGKFSFSGGEFQIEDFSSSEKGVELLKILETKFLDSQYQSQNRDMTPESASRVAVFLKRYDAKVKAAAENSEYQRKLAKLKKAPMKYNKLELDSGYGTSTQVEEFHKHLVVLRNKYSERSKSLRLIVPNDAFPEKYQSIYYDEYHSEMLLREYYRYSSQCLYNTLDLNTCSYIASARADNMLNIAQASLEVEDMPVFYAAMDELSTILSETVKKNTLRFLFGNAVKLGI